VLAAEAAEGRAEQEDVVLHFPRERWVNLRQTHPPPQKKTEEKRQEKYNKYKAASSLFFFSKVSLGLRVKGSLQKKNAAAAVSSNSSSSSSSSRAQLTSARVLGRRASSAPDRL
jgi:hypothetical protein